MHPTPRLPTLRPTLLALAIAALAPAALAAPDDALVPYTVTPHDTLIGLNRTLFATPGAWKEVARINHLPDQDLISPGQVLQVPARLLRSKAVPAQLVSVFGDVRIGDRPAAAGQPLDVGDSIRTGASSTAVVQLADGSRIRLAPETAGRLDEQRRFQIKATAAATDDGLVAASLRLLSGSIEVFASKVLRARPLEVSTPTAVIGVRGTTYRVRNDVTPATDGAPAVDASATETIEGKVHVQVGDDPAQSADVAGGFGATLSPGHKPAVRPLPPAPDLSGVPAQFDHLPIRFRLPGTLPVRVQLADDAAFDHIQVDLHVAAGEEADIPRLAEGRWHLRARSVSAEGLEGLDAARDFQLRVLPDSPMLAYPLSGLKFPVGDITLRWIAETRAATYVVEVARDAAFTQVVWREEQTHGELARFHPVDTDYGAADGVYWWHVVGITADGRRGDWSETHAMTLSPVPRAPVGRAAPDGSAIELAWGGNPANRAEVELARDDAFEDITAHVDFGAGTGAGTLPRQRAGTYYARYRFVEPDGYKTAWSGATRIEVQSNWHQAWRALFAPRAPI